MYRNRYRRYCTQNNYDDNVINATCQNYNTVADYYVSNNSNNLSTNNNSCDCGYNKQDSVFPDNPVLGQSYVPIQTIEKTFVPCVGLKMGTLFPELVSPYSPCQSLEENAFIEAMNEIKEGCNKC